LVSQMLTNGLEREWRSNNNRVLKKAPFRIIKIDKDSYNSMRHFRPI
jgi:hypothetical protein